MQNGEFVDNTGVGRKNRVERGVCAMWDSFFFFKQKTAYEILA